MAFEFKFAHKFPNLIQDDFELAYVEISTQYTGIQELWAKLEPTIRDAKRDLCYNYLVAWYLANINPIEAEDVVHDGGKPLISKNIGGTSLSYKDIEVPPGFEQFTTNVFGLEALKMILSAPERFKIYGKN